MADSICLGAGGHCRSRGDCLLSLDDERHLTIIQLGEMMKILGIDPGYAIVGFGLITSDRENTRLLQYGTITTPADLDFPSRLVMIYDDMVRLMDALKPDAVAVEELFGATMSQRALEFPTAEGSFYWRWPNMGSLCMSTRLCRSSRRWWAMERLRKPGHGYDAQIVKNERDSQAGRCGRRHCHCAVSWQIADVAAAKSGTD